MVNSVQSVVALALLSCVWRAAAEPCEARVRTEAGLVCGACAPGGDYASFLAVPYAKQPLAELRFQELQRPESWEGCRDATLQGPICPQRDPFYGPTVRESEASEACIHANVHVPMTQLTADQNQTLLPVLVYIHGGGFGFGSGDPDLYGPQYLMRDDVVVITFNYRLGPFGFLSLNSSSIPGNAGLRDMVTLLRWVSRNVRAFGGDPARVTLAGHSAGAASAHLLSLSKAAEGLFKRVILMSGTATRSFFTASPAYAKFVADQFLNILGINGTDPEEAHRRLVAMPLERIVAAQSQLQDVYGLAVFTPVVESPHAGVETILDNDPEVLQARGRGEDLPFVIGFTGSECQTFRPRFEAIDIIGQIQKTPLTTMSTSLIYITPLHKINDKIGRIAQKYFNGSPDMNQFLRLCSDSYFIYPAMKLAELRAASGAAPVYLYRFAYEADYSVFREALKLKYRGAAHGDDVTFVFRANQVLGDSALSPRDRAMADAMTARVTDFMRHSNPTNGAAGWPSVSEDKLQYQNIISSELIMTEASRSNRKMMKFFDSLYQANS